MFVNLTGSFYSPLFSHNWNLDEIAMTFQSDIDDKELFFKMLTGNCNIGTMTLKHSARTAVLRSFDRDILEQLNLPKTLFMYLGIQKY